MEKFQSLADYLGVSDELPSTQLAEPRLVDISDPTAFARAVLESREFRQYIVSGLTLGNLPGFTSILQRLMDAAGNWPKASSRVEHTGKDGEPIVTEVRRVVVRVNTLEDLEEDSRPVTNSRPVTTH